MLNTRCAIDGGYDLGKLKFGEGGEYVGQFVDGAFDGFGRLQYPNMGIYEGSFKRGQKQGAFRSSPAHSLCFIRLTVAVSRDVDAGKGQMTLANGKIELGHWKRDKLVELEPDEDFQLEEARQYMYPGVFEAPTNVEPEIRGPAEVRVSLPLVHLETHSPIRWLETASGQVGRPVQRQRSDVGSKKEPRGERKRSEGGRNDEAAREEFESPTASEDPVQQGQVAAVRQEKPVTRALISRWVRQTMFRITAAIVRPSGHELDGRKRAVSCWRIVGLSICNSLSRDNSFGRASASSSTLDVKYLSIAARYTGSVSCSCP